MASKIYNIGCDFYSYIINDNIYKEGQILEPLSCIIKLGMLNLKDDGTKLQIIDNSIKFQSPSILQGTSRWLNGDTRSDLHNLSNPIQIAIEWYNPNTSDDLKYIYEKSLLGLNVLSKSYNADTVSSLVANTITHYKLLLKNALDKNNNSSECSKIKIEEQNNDYKSLWTQSEINIIKNLLEISSKKKEDNKKYDNYLNSIENILNDKDEEIRNIVYKNKTKI